LPKPNPNETVLRCEVHRFIYHSGRIMVSVAILQNPDTLYYNTFDRCYSWWLILLPAAYQEVLIFHVFRYFKLLTFFCTLSLT
jgi:hypothetical protein